ncbi:hypothetical protein [Luteimicrobium sp. DT211]
MGDQAEPRVGRHGAPNREPGWWGFAKMVVRGFFSWLGNAF